MSLFKLDALTRWAGSRALARLELCAYCSTPPQPVTRWIETPLFAHAGYGEATITTIVECECRLTRWVSVTSTNPRPYRP